MSGRFRSIPHLALAATLIFGLSGSALAISDAQFQAAYQHFAQANKGNSAAIDDAADAFLNLIKVDPTNPVLHAYAGSAIAMKATTTALPWKKMSYAEDGLAQLDKALSLLNTNHDAAVQNGIPGVLDVKFVAANTFLGVPSFMNRHERGTKLLADVVGSPLLAGAPLGFRGAVWLKAAKEAHKSKNTAQAKQFLELIVQQQAPQAAQANALLKELAS